MKKYFTLIHLIFLLISVSSVSYAQDKINKSTLQTSPPVQYEKTEFDIALASSFTNPYDSREIGLDLILTSPTGKSITLPCFYVSGNSTTSAWKARFAAQEAGNYSYHFQLKKNNTSVAVSANATLTVAPSAKDGFLHKNDFWTFKFDSGKPFRGIGENVGWESRTWEDPKFNYDNLLSELANNGANFFRTWMSAWNLPLEWKTVVDTDRYSNSTGHFHEGGVQRMDELVELADSLGMYMMLALDYHGGLTSNWSLNNYNSVNGGPANTPTDFFTNAEAKSQYKNRLRYLVARWGYSTSIAAWEFFNEVDNAVYSDETTIAIPHAAVTQWHTEMSAYLKNIDPYDHLITTSISHREIAGMYNIDDIDFNQKHIYRQTGQIPSVLKSYNSSTNKPFVIGEFGYDWDWNNVGPAIGPEMDFDLKRGLWYGVFSPTPILPMTWWWEFFSERNMIPYFKGIRTIHEEMMEAGKGTFQPTDISVTSLDAFGLKCGNKHFIYLLNNGVSDYNNSISYNVAENVDYSLKIYNPEDQTYTVKDNVTASGGVLNIGDLSLKSKKELVLIISPVDNVDEQSPKTGSASPIPGKIEAEDFDTGGEDVGHNDYDNVNNAGEYRINEGVDIETASEGGFNVTDIIQGEWIEYTVDVATSGSYTLEARLASESEGGTFRVELNGVNISGTIEVPNTGGLQTWQTQNITTSNISKGVKVLRIVFESSGFNLNHLNFSLLNEAPIVSLTSPLEDTSFTAPATIDLLAEASDPDGSISKVEFYNKDIKLGESLVSPFTFSWTPTPGMYQIYAKATDNKGLTSESDRINVTVAPSTVQSPYNSAAAPIPGKIEAEEYDKGTNGIAYSDNSPANKFGEFRDDDVDIEACTDEGGGFSLGDLQIGEWVEYTVDVTQEGNYDIEFRIATQSANTKFHLEMDGKNITNSVSVPNTGGWQIWQSIKKENVPLTAGEKVMRLVIEGEYFNLNYLSFTPSLTTGIEEELVDNIKLYPNPAQTSLTLEDKSRLVDKIEIFDLQGRRAFSSSGNQNEINISHLSSGIYQIRLFNRNNNYFKEVRIIKK